MSAPFFLPFSWLPLCLPMLAMAANDNPPPGPFPDTECIACHSERDPSVIDSWRNGPHGISNRAGCNDCHGGIHQESAQRARRNRACSGCHQGAVNHSYVTSKHGVISGLEEKRQDWRKPLRRGHYRSPGCSYCHLHDKDHGDTMDPARGPSLDQWICAGCHSPRYVREQLASGTRLTAIAKRKVQEGEALLANAQSIPAGLSADLGKQLQVHLTNVRLGAGHQSPDYQWWHGQPALDGDLIRIRDHVAKSRLLPTVEPPATDTSEQQDRDVLR